MEGIYFRLDWFSGIFQGYSLRQIAHLFRLDDAMPAFVENGFPTSIGCFQYFAYTWNNCKWFIQASDLAVVGQDVIKSDGIFDVIFPKIKFDISGTGLDWLREHYFEGAEGSDGVMLDDYLRTHFDRFDPTRVDFTFDFVDYRPSLFSEMIEWIKYQEALGVYRLTCKGLCGGVSYTYKLGSESTLYLGSPTCEKLLRVYDKKRQYYDPMLKIWKKAEKDLPYGHPDSWIRFEYQCRRKAAAQILYQPYDDCKHMSKSVLMLIFDRYAFRDPSVNRWQKKAGVLKFWLDLVPDWAHFDDIIQIKHFVQLDGYLERSKKYIKEVAFKSIAVNIAHDGIISFLKFLADRLAALQRGTRDEDEGIAFVSQCSMASFLSTLSSTGINDLSDAVGLVECEDGLHFDFELSDWYKSLFPLEEVS